MVFLWFSYGFPMVFLWVDHVHSTLFHLYGRNDALAAALALDRAAITPVEQR